MKAYLTSLSPLYIYMFLSVFFFFCFFFWCCFSLTVNFSFFLSWYIFVSERCIVSLLDRVVEVKPIMYLSDTSSIAQHLKNHSCPTTELQKILTENTTILEHQNNKQKLQILKALHIRNIQPKLNRINFRTSANVLKCLSLLTLFI